MHRDGRKNSSNRSFSALSARAIKIRTHFILFNDRL